MRHFNFSHTEEECKHFIPLYKGGGGHEKLYGVVTCLERGGGGSHKVPYPRFSHFVAPPPPPHI